MRLLAGLLLLIHSLVSYAETPTILTVPAGENQFSVQLPANPTTGYQWQVVSYDTNLLKLINSTYLPPDSKLIGAGGNSLFVFQLKQAPTSSNQTSIQFKYARPWEHSSGTLKTITVRFTQVKSAPAANK